MTDQDYKKYKVYVTPESVKNPKGKTGCTQDMGRVRNQEAEVIYDTDDIFMASMAERMNQILYGQKVDRILYHKLPSVTGDMDRTKCNSKEAVSKCKATKIKNGTTTDAPEIQKRRRETMEKNGTTPDSPEFKAKVKVTKERNGTTASSPLVVAKQKATRIKNGTEDTNPLIIEKRLATMKRNGTTGDRNTPESKAKGKATKERNGTTGKNMVSYCDLRTGKRGRCSSEEFHLHDYLVGTTSKKLNYTKENNG